MVGLKTKPGSAGKFTSSICGVVLLLVFSSESASFAAKQLSCGATNLSFANKKHDTSENVAPSASASLDFVTTHESLQDKHSTRHLYTMIRLRSSGKLTCSVFVFAEHSNSSTNRFGGRFVVTGDDDDADARVATILHRLVDLCSGGIEHSDDANEGHFGLHAECENVWAARNANIARNISRWFWERFRYSLNVIGTARKFPQLHILPLISSQSNLFF